jgi:hypothetical protein
MLDPALTPHMAVVLTTPAVSLTIQRVKIATSDTEAHLQMQRKHPLPPHNTAHFQGVARSLTKSPSVISACVT